MQTNPRTSGPATSPLALTGWLIAVLLALASPAASGVPADDVRQCTEEKDLQRAYEACSRALGAAGLRGQDLARVYFNRATILSDTGKHLDAIADFTRAIELSPTYHQALNERGRAHRALREYDEAIADFSAALRLKPEQARYLSNRGLAHKLKGDYRLALADYDAALRINSEDNVALHNRGTLQRELKNFPAAVSDLTRSLQFDPGDASTMVQLGRVYADQARHAEAIRHFDQVIERSPKYGFAWLQRGLSHLALGQGDLAQLDLKKAEELGERGPRLKSALDTARRLASSNDAPVSGGQPVPGPRRLAAAAGEASPPATGPAEIQRSGSARPLPSREAIAGPEYIDLPKTVGTLSFETKPRWPDVMARGGRRLLRPANGWHRDSGGIATRMGWRTQEGPFFEGPHFRLRTAAVYSSPTENSDFVTIKILWYPQGSGGGICTPQVNFVRETGDTGIISQRGDVRVIFSPSAFLFARRRVPDLAALKTFAQAIFAQLEPYANPCRPGRGDQRSPRGVGRTAGSPGKAVNPDFDMGGELDF